MPRPKSASQSKPPLQPQASAASADAEQPLPTRLWLRAAGAAMMGGWMGVVLDALLPGTRRRRKN